MQFAHRLPCRATVASVLPVERVRLLNCVQARPD